MPSAYVDGYLVVRATRQTVARWIRSNGTTHRCNVCDKRLDPGQWFVSIRGTGSEYGEQIRIHVACLNDYWCPDREEILKFVREQEAAA